MPDRKAQWAVPAGILFAGILLGGAGGALLRATPPAAALPAEAMTRTPWVEEVAGDIAFPAGIAWLPGGDALIAERAQGLRILRNGKLGAPIAGLPALYTKGLNGLRDIAVDPEFATNRQVYLLVTEGSEQAFHAAVYRARLETAGLTAVQRIFRSRDAMHGVHSIASRLALLADGTLLIGISASVDENRQLAQDLRSHIGKILRIARDGSIPADNPFRGRADALPEIWSYGHRVPLGLFQDPRSREVWEAESGPRGGDELNRLEAGGNYGWAHASWGRGYDGGLIAPVPTAPGMIDPVLQWTPSVTPSGLTRIDGKHYPQWRGDFIVGHLTTRQIERVRFDQGRAVLQERLLIALDERIREVKTGPDGYVYLLTDHARGRLLRLRVDAPPPGVTPATRLAAPAAAPLPAPPAFDPRAAAAAFADRCAACHRIGSAQPGGNIGPDLAGVFGRRMATRPGFAYSAAMTRMTQRWDAATLARFLADPQGLVPGTAMSIPPVDAAASAQIVELLKREAGAVAANPRHGEPGR